MLVQMGSPYISPEYRGFVEAGIAGDVLDHSLHDHYILPGVDETLGMSAAPEGGNHTALLLYCMCGLSAAYCANVAPADSQHC